MKKKILVNSLLALLVLNLIVWYSVFAEERGNILKVVFLDIGQGDSIYIEAPNGNQVLIDGGPNKKILEKLGEVMPIYDKTIDVVIATHPDADHIGGLPEVLDKYSVQKVFEPNSSSTSETYQALENIILKKHLEKVIAERGQEIILDENPEIKLEILSPEAGTKFKDTNESSIVAKLIYASSTFLFTGDLPKNVESRLVYLDKNDLKSDVLKVGHHGSRTSSGADFISAVSPTYAIISAGQNNKYGHPHQEVLDILEKFHAQILKTFEVGNIEFVTDGKILNLI